MHFNATCLEKNDSLMACTQTYPAFKLFTQGSCQMLSANLVLPIKFSLQSILITSRTLKKGLKDFDTVLYNHGNNRIV